MTTSNTTLTSLWVEDGQTGQMKGIPTPSTPDGASKKMPDDIMDFFRDSGFDAIAKEAGIIEEEVVTIPHTIAQAPPKNKTIKLIAVPVSSKTQFAHQMAATPRAVLMSQATPIVMASTAQPTVFSMAQVEGGRGQNNMPKIIQLITTQSNSNMQHPQSWTVTTNKRQNTVTVDSMDQFLSDSKRRKGTHGGKGLRHFSMKVCEKVQKKGVTSYNEVADELVNEFSDPLNSDMMLFVSDKGSNFTDSHEFAESRQQQGDQSFDQKNIRRRVYDALNVLMAMNIISKEKKEIRWIGLPTNSAQECQNLELEKKKLVERIQVKTQQLNELILQQIAFKNLVERNRIAEEGQGPPGSNSAIQLPFILVNTSKKTVIDCSISNDKYEYLFNFDQTFEIHDDIEVLKRMGMAFGLEKGKCSQADLNKAVRMVPKALQPYVIDMANPNSKSKPVSIKLEPGTSSSSYRQGSIYSTTEESLDDEVAWTIDGNLSRQSSYASRSEQQTPDFSDDDSDS